MSDRRLSQTPTHVVITRVVPVRMGSEHPDCEYHFSLDSVIEAVAMMDYPDHELIGVLRMDGSHENREQILDMAEEDKREAEAQRRDELRHRPSWSVA